MVYKSNQNGKMSLGQARRTGIYYPYSQQLNNEEFTKRSSRYPGGAMDPAKCNFSRDGKKLLCILDYEGKRKYMKEFSQGGSIFEKIKNAVKNAFIENEGD